MIKGEEKVSLLVKAAQDKYNKAKPELEKLPFDIIILETLRSTLTQIAYAAQGRLAANDVAVLRGIAGIKGAAGTGVITQLDGIIKRSKHQDGKALDIVPLKNGAVDWNASEDQWLALGEIARKSGFTWGGDWKNNPAAKLGWDCPHWEII